MAKQTQNNEKIKYNKFPLRKINFILMAVFGLMIVLGFILMAGSSNGEEFNPDIFSTRRIVVGRLRPYGCGHHVPQEFIRQQ